MSYEMDVTFEGDHLYLHVTAEDSYETSLKFFGDLIGECRKCDCERILVVSDTTPLTTMAAYDHHEILSNVGFTFSHRIAWVEINPEAREMDKFIEDVLVNRCIIQVKIFSDESEAKQWLLGDTSA
jgi:hypothetical protein